MTTILGLRSGGVSYLAADSRLCGPNPLPADVEKVKEVGPWIIALSGDARLLDLVERWRVTIETASRALDVAEALRRAVIDDGWRVKDQPGSPEYGNFGILLGSREGLWHIACDFQVIQIADDRIFGQGSGREYAEGAFAALGERECDSVTRLRRAVEIAAAFDPGTGGEIRVLTSENAARSAGDDPVDVLLRLQSESPVDTSRFNGKHALILTPPA